MDDNVDILRRVPVFARLGRGDLRRLLRRARSVEFPPGREVVREGEPGDCLFVLTDGEAKVVVGGETKVVLTRGDFFGEMALLDTGTRSATVKTSSPVTCLTIAQADFRNLVLKRPEIALALLGELARRLRLAQEDAARR